MLGEPRDVLFEPLPWMMLAHIEGLPARPHDTWDDVRTERALQPEEAPSQREVELLHRHVDEVHRGDDVEVSGEANGPALSAFAEHRQVDLGVSVLQRRERFSE